MKLTATTVPYSGTVGSGLMLNRDGKPIAMLAIHSVMTVADPGGAGYRDEHRELSEKIAEAVARAINDAVPPGATVGKQSSPEMSSLAARLMKHHDRDVRSLAASVLSQDETKGQS